MSASPGTAVTSGKEATHSGVRRVLWVTLFLNVAVSAAKILVGHLSGSLALVADGYHSLVDGANNIIGLIVAAFAYAPPDSGHPYGHRKFETAAALAIGLGLLALAYRVLAGTLFGAVQPRLPTIGPAAWGVMLVTLAVNFFVSRYETRQGQRLGSAYLIADAAHTRSDLYVSLGVIISFVGAHAGQRWADPVVATAIAALIAVQAVRLLLDSFHVLTDRAPIPADAISAVVREVSGVQDCRIARTRGGPGAVYVDLVVHVDGGLTLREAHDIADRVEHAVQARHPHVVDVVVHLEPADDPRAPHA